MPVTRLRPFRLSDSHGLAATFLFSNWGRPGSMGGHTIRSGDRPSKAKGRGRFALGAAHRGGRPLGRGQLSQKLKYRYIPATRPSTTSVAMTSQRFQLARFSRRCSGVAVA